MLDNSGRAPYNAQAKMGPGKVGRTLNSTMPLLQVLFTRTFDTIIGAEILKDRPVGGKRGGVPNLGANRQTCAKKRVFVI